MKVKKPTSKIIENLKQQLEDDKLYSSKDYLLLTLLENAYSQYLTAIENVKQQGAVIEFLDTNENTRQRINPHYTVSLELSKEILKYLNMLYATPASRQLLKELANKQDDNDPFNKLVTTMKRMDEEIETR